MRPETLVGDMVEDTAIERVVLHRCEVPDLCLNVRLPSAIFLQHILRKSTHEVKLSVKGS